MSNNKFLTTMQLSHLLATEIGINGDEATIIDTIHSYKNTVSMQNLRVTIMELFHVDIDQERLVATVKRLVKKDKIYRISERLYLTPQTIEEIRLTIQNNQLVEDTALEEWLKQYQESYNFVLTSSNHESIRSCILGFIRTFFINHGADCYKIITGEKQSSFFNAESLAKDCLRNVDADHFDSLLCFLNEILSTELTYSQMAFLSNQLRKAVHYLSMVVDSPTQAALMGQFSNTTIYLDTAVIYRLLNLQGEDRFESINKLINMCQKSNITLKIFQTSFNELKRRINYDAQIIIKHPTPVSFASIGYKCRTSENYISTFWKEQSQHGISARDFNYRFSNLGVLLKEYNIEIDETDYISIHMLQDKKINFYDKVTRYDTRDQEYKKTLNSVEHDSECLACVEYLQVNNASSVIDAKTFFLSTDRSLIKLQRYDSEYKNKTDLVVLPSQLVQIFCMTSSTTDYYEAFLGLFSSSHAAFGTSALDNSQIQEIMGRVASYKGTTPAFAEKILSSQLIQTSFLYKETEEEKNELIDNAMISQVEAMEEVLEIKDKTIEDVAFANKKKENQIDELSERIKLLEDIQKTSDENLNDAEDAISKYQKHFENDAIKYSNSMAQAHMVGGWVLLLLGVFGMFISILALIPITSHYVSPIFIWIGSSIVFQGVKNNQHSIIGIVIAISTALISGGITCKRDGFSKIAEKYYNTRLEKL